MINLLPPNEKKILLAMQNRALALVVMFIFLISFICFLLVLLSLYFYIAGQVAYQEDILQSTKSKYQTADFLKYKNIISQSNQTLTKADDFYKNRMNVSNALKVLSAIEKPQNLYLKNIAAELVKKSTVKVSVFGVSDTRENLLLFKNNIEHEAAVANIYFPPDNWIKAKDVNFYFTFELKTESHESAQE